MKCILIPVDFNAATQSVLSYVISFCNDVQVEQIILFKNFYQPVIADVLPDANYVDGGNQNYIEGLQQMRKELDKMAHRLKKIVPVHTSVENCLVDDKWLPAMQRIIDLNEPELILLGNDPHAVSNDSIIADKIIPFSKSSNVPVLIVPIDSVYKKLKRVLIPTSFENMDRLFLMQKLCVSNAWLQATMLVLNVDSSGKDMLLSDKHKALLDEYLKGYHYQIIYSNASDTVQEILSYAKKSDVQLIMALPGKHSFLHRFRHQSVTETFALNAHHPVLLLK